MNYVNAVDYSPLMWGWLFFPVPGLALLVGIGLVVTQLPDRALGRTARYRVGVASLVLAAAMGLLLLAAMVAGPMAVA